MELVHHLAELYAEKYSSPLSPELQKIADDTYQHHSHSIMLSGHLQGLFLQMVSYMLKPLNVLEIGTFTGFSAIALAQGLQTGGQVHTIEIREEDALLSKANIDMAGCSHKITVHLGDAREVIPKFSQEWDLVFIDADKPSYIDYYELVLPKLRADGFILVDNVLFHGQVLEDNVTGKNAKAIQKFNEHIANDTRIQKVVITLRDGITIIRKK